MSPEVVDITREGWTIRHDPEDRGLREAWQERPPEGGWVPGRAGEAWQKSLGVNATGVAWYRRKIRVPAPWRGAGARVWVRFESVATDCRVWVNGVEVGRHVGDYLPFQFEITGAAATFGAEEDAELVVRVDQIHAPRPAPGVLTENGHITKGFHDVLSLQHGGIWGGVSLRRTGPVAISPNGVSLIGDPADGRLRVRVEMEQHARAGEVTVYDGAYQKLLHVFDFDSAQKVAESEFAWRSAEAWSPDKPVLSQVYVEVQADVLGGLASKASDGVAARFGMRQVATGGPGNRNILLNGTPVLIRGVLHWGHEPEHIAPAPTPEQVRGEFARLKEMGFNCVCLCMWYAPEWYYDIADEMGMLIWQEHPVWKSPMEEEHIPEYKRLFEGFFRRDRRHPSVVIVSGSCEHERFHPQLAEWWWERAKQELPGTLKQVQTAFLAWTNPEQTDLHDEHVYESGGRWVAYMEDLQRALAKLPPKPFVMGETIIGASWLDAAAFDSPKESRPWWYPKGLDECRGFEGWMAGRYGEGTLKRFKRQADRFNFIQRKFQSEVFRSFPNHAGWVMNQIRDVSAARLGFMDDLGRWRFDGFEKRSWLGERAVLLQPPGWRHGLVAGRRAEFRIGISNFSGEPFDGDVTLTEVGKALPALKRAQAAGPLRCAPGDVVDVPLHLELPRVESPVMHVVVAGAADAVGNGWDLWLFPEPADVPEGVVRMDGIEFSQKDREPDFEERAYSSGWGLQCETWRPVLPDPSVVLFKCPLWRFDAPLPGGTRVIVTHKLTRSVVEFLDGGGRVVLLASKTAGGLGTKYFTTWAQSPLVIESDPMSEFLHEHAGVPRDRPGTPPRYGTTAEAKASLAMMLENSASPPYPPWHNWPIRKGDSEWIVDLLHHDLTRRYTRAIPVTELGIIDQVDPVVRLVFTHDSGVPRPMDAVFAARVGKGMLIATSLDHTEDAGRYLVHLLLEWAVMDGAACRGELDPALVRSWTVEAAGR